MSRVKFVSNRDGYDNVPNTYTVVCDNGDEFGILVKRDGAWQCYPKVTSVIGGVKFSFSRHIKVAAPTLSKLRKKVEALIDV